MPNRKEEMFDFAIRHLWHKIARLYNQKANQHGVTISVGFILLNVEKKGTPSTQLGPKMGMEPTSLSRTIKSMEDNGLIRREADPDDGRRVLIFLTELGVEKRKLAKSVIVGFNQKLSGAIPSGMTKTFFEVANRLDAVLDNELNSLTE